MNIMIKKVWMGFNDQYGKWSTLSDNPTEAEKRRYREVKCFIEIPDSPLTAMPMYDVVASAEEMRKALRFYAGLEDDAHWDGNRFIAVNKFGHVDPLASGPTVALQALGATK